MLPLSDVNTAIIAAVLALRDSRPEAQRHRLDGRQRDGVPAVTAVNSFGEAGLPLSPSVRPPRAASVAGRGPPAHSRVVPHSAGKFTSMVLVSGEVPFLSRPCPLDEFTRLFTPRTLPSSSVHFACGCGRSQLTTSRRAESMDSTSTGSRRGRGGIRTHEAFTPACFQDKCLRPLGNAPMIDGRLGPQVPLAKFIVSRCAQSPRHRLDRGRAAGFRHRLGPDSRSRWDPALREAGHAVKRCWHLGETVPRVGFAPTLQRMELGFEPSASTVPATGAVPSFLPKALGGSRLVLTG